MCEIMNESFKTVFTTNDFTEPIILRHGIAKDYRRSQCTKRILEDYWIIGDGVSVWVLKECKDQLLDPIWEIITNSINEGKASLE
ncbi:hypothetical protein E2C01_075160 [Portunus trituberculatus]|uniref:Uncharacterized protein n=1 Tax=Portunus trituberculatus TaxID=210409 RepID=A0A5B7IIE4_PORTR|nr:hypothetical protein [Portunus trituberculatus]